jgi:dye decolorizing peroxidase
MNNGVKPGQWAGGLGGNLWISLGVHNWMTTDREPRPGGPARTDGPSANLPEPEGSASSATAATDAKDPSDRDNRGDHPRPTVSRRRFFGAAAAAGLVGAGAAVAAEEWAHAADQPPELTTLGQRRVAFHGVHQAGIADRAQARGHFLAFDLLPAANLTGLRALLRRWTDLAAGLTQGDPVGDDDLVAAGSGPASLTVTVGFGPSLFDRVPFDPRLRPAALAQVPAFRTDRLDPARSGGDLLVQVGADDALVAFHAARTLTRAATESGVVRTRWRMAGFNTSPGARADERATPRNLMGQIDGTNNPRPGTAAFDSAVFVGPRTSPAWLRNGSYLVFRRIRMLLDNWDRLDRATQERVVGRRKDTGAPLTGGVEHTPADFAAQNPAGGFVIPPDAHIRLARSDANDGAVMLRRSFSYDDGSRPDGTPDAGLLFAAWQADPAAGFVRVQQHLVGGGDALGHFIEHESSAVFAAPGGCQPGGYLGQELLES